MPASPRFRFDAFVFHPETGALKRHGHAVRLSEQAAKVLAELLEHPDQLVTRSQITELLWPGGIYTEGNQGINNVISKLRITLRDDPKNPKFIETVPQRGYRFLMPVLTDESGTPHRNASAVVSPPAFPSEGSEAEDLSFQKFAGHGTARALVAASPVDVIGPTQRRFPASVYMASALVILCAVGAALWRNYRHSPAPAPRQIALAVAPFEITGTSPNRQQLAESFRLDLTDTLSQLPGIQVRAAHSVGQRGAIELRPGNDQLHLDAILFTQFIQNGDQCVLQVEMVRSSDSTHLNSWHYSGTTAQLGLIRDQMQRDIFAYWKGPGENQRASKGGTEDAAAYELYLRARYHARQRSPDSLQAAVKEYQQALDRDPQFAKAYAGLADANYALSSVMVMDTRNGYSKAESYATKALELAPNLAEAHAILGYMYFRNDWRFADGEQEIRQAITLDPAEPNYHNWYATMLTMLGRFQEAASELDTAKKYDPYWAPIYATEAYLDASSHQWEKMNKATDMLVALKPDWPGTYDELAWGYWLSDHPEKAIAEWRKMAVMKKDLNRTALEDRGMQAFRQGGAKAYAKLRLKAAIDRADMNPGDPDFQIAEWYAYSGDNENCLLALKKMVDSHDMRVLEISFNPAYAALRHDPRYQELLRRVGLPLPA
jgi:DNA-binding winged helix-turn-helix (wHTH) protein/tetratricopeptide (TPR) repeat protein/TolB-like protein